MGSAALGASTTAAAFAGRAYLAARRGRPSWQEPHRSSRRAGLLEVAVVGAGLPVLLLHGLVGSGRFWGAAYDVVAADHRLIVPDLLGFGRSHRPDRGYGPDDHVDAVSAALDALDVTEPVIIGAHSLGTVVALRFASRHPDRVVKVTAFGPPLYRDADGAKRRIGAASPMAKLIALPGSLAERSCRWVCDHRAMAARMAQWSHPGLPPALAADAVEHTWSSYSETLERCLLTGEPATWLDGIAAPVRLIAGASDPVVDHDFLRVLSAGTPDLRVEQWPGDHRLPLSDPDRCLASILR